jgi:hypothetical protein
MRLHGDIFQKAIFMLDAVRTWNLTTETSSVLNIGYGMDDIQHSSKLVPAVARIFKDHRPRV